MVYSKKWKKKRELGKRELEAIEKRGGSRWTSEDVEELKKEGRVGSVTLSEKNIIKGNIDQFAKILTAAKKSGSISKYLERKLDRDVQKFIRLRGADEYGKCKCASCGVLMDWKGTGKMHAGHWISRGFWPTRWDLRNIFPQCFKCNDPRHGNGMPYELGKEVERVYGEEVAKELKRISKQGKGLNTVERIEKLIFIREESKRLAKEKGLKLN